MARRSEAWRLRLRSYCPPAGRRSCPKGYDQKGDTCYRHRDGGIGPDMSDAAADSSEDMSSDDSDTDGGVEDTGSQAASGDAGSCGDAGTGARCDAAATIGDACDPDPCEHGARCSRTADGSRCGCADTGYEGMTCDREIDECAGPNSCTSPDYPCVETEPPGYTCQGELADWPMPDAVPGATVRPSYDVATSPEFVIDNVTGLVWQRRLPATYAGCTGVDQVMSDCCGWQEAKTIAAPSCSRVSRTGGCRPRWSSNRLSTIRVRRHRLSILSRFPTCR